MEEAPKKMQEEFLVLKKQFGGQHLWATGYFCRIAGTVTSQMIEEYITNQKDSVDKIFNHNNMF